jgi:putative ABC transport system ATP-binding protein
MSNQSSRAAIVARQVTKRIDTATHTVEILKGIDFEVERGQFVAIMGASGSGKSTLLGLLAGLDAPTSGQILLDGADITGLEEDELALLRGRKVGFVFQSYQLIPTLTAEENVLLPLDLAGERDGRDRARELLDRVGLLDRRDHYPVQLSGGEQQRVALARAFVMRPPILMADEPTGNLDTKNGRLVLDLLLQLNQREKATLLLVTHDRELASFADRKITLSDGAIAGDELQLSVRTGSDRGRD